MISNVSHLMIWAAPHFIFSSRLLVDDNYYSFESFYYYYINITFFYFFLGETSGTKLNLKTELKLFNLWEITFSSEVKLGYFCCFFNYNLLLILMQFCLSYSDDYSQWSSMTEADASCINGHEKHSTSEITDITASSWQPDPVSL